MAQIVNIRNITVIVASPVKIRMMERNANVHLDSRVNDVKVRCCITLPSLLGGHILFVFGPFIVLSSIKSLFLSAS